MRTERAAVLRRPTQAVSDTLREGVRAIFDAVAARGDDALRDYTARFDGVAFGEFEVDAEEFDAAVAQVPADVQAAIREAAARIEAFHRAGIAQPYAVETAPGVLCERVQRPINRVGLYVPAGSAPLPSTALMLCIPARLAGCARGHPVHAAARGRQCRSRRAAGGAAGAGRARVQARRRAGDRRDGARHAPVCRAATSCSGPATPGWTRPSGRPRSGPVGSPSTCRPGRPRCWSSPTPARMPAFVAADLLSQAEHGPDSQVLLLTDGAALLDAVAAEVDAQLARAAARRHRPPRAGSVAPGAGARHRTGHRHQQCLRAGTPDPGGARAARLAATQVHNAGSIFLGDWTPEALGDYCSGSNHVLPTGGAARAWSGLSVASFQKTITVQEASRAGIANAGPCAATLAHAEGLQAHARAVGLRLEQAA